MKFVRLDDERVAFEVADRRSHVLAHARAGLCASVERNDPRVVQHLVADGDLGRRLDDAHRVTVERRHDRAGHAAADAAVVIGEVLRREERPVGLTAASRLPLPPLLGERRHLTVLGLDDVRRVAEHASAGLGRVERAQLDPARVFRLLGDECREAAGAGGQALAKFFVREELARTELVGPLQRDAAHVAARERSLEVRVAPGEARRPPVPLGGRGRGLLGGDRLSRGVLRARVHACKRGPPTGRPPMRCAYSCPPPNAAFQVE